MLNRSVSLKDPVATQLLSSGDSNALLNSLPPAEFDAVKPYLKTIGVSSHQYLQTQDERIDHVFFPQRSAVCAVIKNMPDGKTLQVATVGSEGVLGVGVVLGDTVSSADVQVQMAGSGVTAMPAVAFKVLLEKRTVFFEVVRKYAADFARELMQVAACNGIHSVEQRCCRWLLTTQDRANSAKLPFTHDYLSDMLGVRRPTVTVVCNALQRSGAISYRRGSLHIVDRQRLEQASCECYWTANATLKSEPDTHEEAGIA